MNGVEKCFSNEKKAYEINAYFPNKVLNLISKKKIYLIHFSSDSVFAGKKNKLNTLYENIKCINTEYFGYNLYDLNEFDRIHINSYLYKNKSQYDWHHDGSKSHVFDIKFTIIINTSLNKYEGGKFYLFDNGPKHIETLDNPGSVLMFKSYINHKVEPVVKGTRDSMAIFVKGPKFV